MSLSLLACLPVALGQWGVLPQQQIMGQYPSQFGQGGGFGQSGYPMVGSSVYSSSPFDSRAGASLIRPGGMGFGYPSMPQMSSLQQMSSFPQMPQPYPLMNGVPTSMGAQIDPSFSGYSPQLLSQHMQPMHQGLSLGGFGQFQSDSRANAVEKKVSPLEPTRIIPPFLKNASPQQLDEFYAIVQNPVWSPSEKQAKIEEFVRGMDVNVQNTFAEFERASSSASEAKRQKVHRLVDDMSPEAQVQFQKVSALMTNPAVNETERLRKVQELYAKIPDNIKKEFDDKLANL